MNTLLKAKSFLENNRLATIATISGNSRSPQAAVVYYTYENGQIYFATEKNSRKAKNVIKNKKIALVIVQEKQLETLQIEGYGEILEDSDERLRIIMQIFERISKSNTPGPWPAMKLHPKNLEVFEVDLEWFKYSNFAEDVVIIEGTSSEWNDPLRYGGAPHKHRTPTHPHIKKR